MKTVRHTLEEKGAVISDTLLGVWLKHWTAIGGGVDSRILSVQSTLRRHFARAVVARAKIEDRSEILWGAV